MDLRTESGGHRIQRIPPTEKRGRVHTITVTVVVFKLDENERDSTIINSNDLVVDWFSGTGKGGQHRNKKQNSCRLKHLPTGIITSAQTRQRKTSYNLALRELEKQIQHLNDNAVESSMKTIRQNLAGSGMRADKIRTYRFQDDQVKDHRNGKTAKVSKVMKGNFDLLR